MRRKQVDNPGVMTIEQMILFIEDLIGVDGFDKNDLIEFDAGRQCRGQIVLRKRGEEE